MGREFFTYSNTKARAAINSRFPCSVSGCRHRRDHTNSLCSWHRKRRDRWGAPTAGPIRKHQLAPYLRSVRTFLDAHTQHPAVVAALKFTEEALLTPGERPRPESVDNPAWLLYRELARLTQAGVTPRRALETIAAVYLLSEYQPRALPDDARLTHALAQCVLRLAPLRGYRKVITRGPVKHCWTPGARVSTLLGGRIRDNLSVFLHNLRVGIEASVDQQQKAKEALRTPFTVTVTTNTTNTNTEDEQCRAQSVRKHGMP